MNFEDEKDYIMRVIKEMVRMLFALLFGKSSSALNRNCQMDMRCPDSRWTNY